MHGFTSSVFLLREILCMLLNYLRPTNVQLIIIKKMNYLPTLLPLCVVLPILVLNSPALCVWYVRPNGRPIPCPGRPCFTLDHYAEQTSLYFNAGATFVFLAGLRTRLNLTNTSDITLRGKGKDSDTNIYSAGTESQFSVKMSQE